MLNIKRTDHVSNNQIYKTTNTQPLITRVRQRQLRFIGHALRMPVEEPLRTYALYVPPHGRRRPGRQRANYLTYIQNLLGDTEGDLIPDRIAALAADRLTWNGLAGHLRRENPISLDVWVRGDSTAGSVDVWVRGYPPNIVQMTYSCTMMRSFVSPGRRCLGARPTGQDPRMSGCEATRPNANTVQLTYSGKMMRSFVDPGRDVWARGYPPGLAPRMSGCEATHPNANIGQMTYGRSMMRSFAHPHRGCLGARLPARPGSPDVWVRGYPPGLAPRMSGCEATRMNRLPGCLGARLQHGLAPRMSGCEATNIVQMTYGCTMMRSFVRPGPA
ncbi:hypothetical protein Bbelb_357970 [Branchiostoma belcheri]|nr:hypothetical protein Bbelb_357970 [Branchiostoma belcheri]